MKHLQKTTMPSQALIGGIALCCVLLIASCSPKEESPSGFILPPGDIIAGQTTFSAIGCVNCHKVEGVTFTDDGGYFAPELIVPLGGPQQRVTTYGQLVTAVIHPNAAILQNNTRYMDADGNSLMPNYSQTMTVQQMTDLVTFLQEHYEIERPVYDPHILNYQYVH